MPITPNSPTFRTDEHILRVKEIYAPYTDANSSVNIVLEEGPVAGNRYLSLDIHKILVIHKIQEIPMALEDYMTYPYMAPDNSKTLEILKVLHTLEISEPLKGVAIHNILEPLGIVEVHSILYTLKVLEIRRVLLHHRMLEHLKSLNIDQLRHILNLPFSIIRDCTKDIIDLKINNLDNFQHLKALFPNFPNGMPKLCYLDISCMPPKGVWDPLSDSPFEKFPNTLKRLSLSCIPLQFFSTINSLTEFSYLNLTFAYPVDILLDFLKENPCLMEITISIKFKHPDHRYSKAQAPIYLKQLRSLRIHCENLKDTKDLVTYVPIQNEYSFSSISFELQGMQLKDILSSSKDIIALPVEISICFNTISASIELSRPGRHLNIYPVSHSEMASVLKGETELSFENLTHLSLNMPNLPPINLLLCKFPALKSLTIVEDMEAPTLFKLFSSQDPPLLDNIEIHTNIHLDNSSNFIKALRRFASSNRMVLSDAKIEAGYDRSALFCRMVRADPSLCLTTPIAEADEETLAWMCEIIANEGAS